MRIVSIGGGPAGLYTSILLKKALPQASISVYERNRADDTFGWGVVFSSETLSGFELADAPSYRRITEEFRYWDDIETYALGECVRSTGHGFCGMSRRKLLMILQERAAELGVELLFETDVPGVDAFADASLILGADGIHSQVRAQFEDRFQPSFDWRKCKFAWFGTSRPLDAFTFHFKQNEHGLWRVHAYPFDDGLSTWIVECREETWRRAGLDEADEAQSVEYCQELFREELGGHPLLVNKSVWRTFPTIRCERWYHGNVVLLGDAVHTAHFSIGSGTKLAMEDGIALAEAFIANDGASVPQVLEAYQEARFVETLKLQKAAQTSLEWFENTERYMQQDPVTFSFNLMTRSKRITYENLAKRDPQLVRAADRVFGEREGSPRRGDGSYAPPMFAPYRLRELELPNRIVVSPMCQYSAVDGVPQDWHLVHLGSRAIGGAGLVLTEMTDVEPEGRITKGCAGLWNDEQMQAWKRIVDFVHRESPARIGIQIAHAGRKASCAHPWDRGEDRPLTAEEGAWQAYGPTATPFRESWPAPKRMDREDMDRVRDAFVRSTELALEAGFDSVELHMAHGYLLSSFLSPASNDREDEYGGDLEGRMRYPLEVAEAVRAAWPEERPLLVRISATDWLGDEGMTIEDSIQLVRELAARGIDAIDVSTAGNVIESKPIYGRMYQVPFAEEIRHATGIPVMAVGAVLGADHANTILAAGRADLVCMARPHLGDPYLTTRAAGHYGFDEQWWPGPYRAMRP
jgi:anthraniloyl-CoA monooxygenase